MFTQILLHKEPIFRNLIIIYKIKLIKTLIKKIYKVYNIIAFRKTINNLKYKTSSYLLNKIKIYKINKSNLMNKTQYKIKVNKLHIKKKINNQNIRTEI